MTDILLNPALGDEARRERAFAGDILLLTGRAGLLALAGHADGLLREAFGGLDPQAAQFSLPVPEFIRVVGPAKSRFTNDRRTHELLAAALADLGCDPGETYFDLPRLRAVPSGGYLTAGVSYAYKAHRDTWYAHPQALVNWWMPVYPVLPESAMSIFPAHFAKPIANGSRGFDYGDWLANARFAAASQVSADARPHPLPEEPVDTAGELRVAGQGGDAMVFSGCQLHATVPNSSGRTRFSVDFRTVSLRDLREGRGPDNLDSEATGTTLGDFLRVSDLAPLDLSGLDLSVAHKPPRWQARAAA